MDKEGIIPIEKEKKTILVADDEAINRALLGNILASKYDVLYAADGEETLKMMEEHKDLLSLVLLDVLMPKKSGFEVLEEVKDKYDIPIIVLTSEAKSEVGCLEMGAVDFIPKPYPDPQVILARAERSIDLNEKSQIIQQTEKDPLTGLYNKEFFYSYAEQHDSHHKDEPMDAILLDINHFHMINERYGSAYGDEVLKRIGEKLEDYVANNGGLACRKDADTFLLYRPHKEDYKNILEVAGKGFSSDELSNRVRMRMGVYSIVDKSLAIERRFDHAKTAADTVKNSYTKMIGIYDDDLHERELYAEQLIEDFSTAIAKEQFQVYYQPKFDVQSDVPFLASAEALVRWIHPKLGMVSPGVFIPLFEENGLIERLDRYVWDKTARQIKDWKEKFGFAIPISVNVSRIDMFDPQMIDVLSDILKKYDLSFDDLILEVTESAYTDDSLQIIDMVKKLRSLGFKIEMDDFGTGYSSLHMISTMPIDAMKLDINFVRNAFKPGGNTRMLEVIIDIADFLNVPVIAEGVETERQLDALKSLGCEIVQGYFFSKPVPAYEFEPFILQRKEAEKAKLKEESDIEDRVKEARIDEAKKEAEKMDDGPEPEEKHKAISIRTANIIFSTAAVIAAIILFVADISVARGYRRMEEASNRYIEARNAAFNMEVGSDYLTDRVRSFVVTGDLVYLNDFFEEVNVTRRRDNALIDLERLLEGNNSSALLSLNNALDLSNELVETEYKAMSLILHSKTYDSSLIPKEIKTIELSEEEKTLSSQQLEERARDLVFNDHYMDYKERIRENVSLCTQELIDTSSVALEEATDRLSFLVNLQSFVTLLFFAFICAFVALIATQVRTPLLRMVKKMREEKKIEPKGVEELRFVARTYNEILEQNQNTQEKLSHEASHDALTGLLNRGAYELLIQDVDRDHMALLIIDVDHFKQINDTYGHAVGDRVLIRVAEVLRHSFRSVDIICRLGGDEFVVVMTRVNSSMRQLVENKISSANEVLSDPKDDLPVVSLSVGVAFSDRKDPGEDIFLDADEALYKVKAAGGRGCGFHGS